MDITKTSVWKSRKPGLSGPDFDVLSAQNTVIAKQNEAILRLLSSQDCNKGDYPTKDTSALHLYENMRELLLQLSRDFVEQNNGRMSGKKTETAKNMGAPAWKVFVLDSLTSKEEPEEIHDKISHLIEGMAHPALVDVFVKLSKIPVEQKLESSFYDRKQQEKGFYEGGDGDNKSESQEKSPNPRK